MPLPLGLELGIIAAMRGKSVQCIGFILLLCGICAAQNGIVGSPDSLVIARDTFWDIGPPFNYYDLIQIKTDPQGLAVDQVLVTPHGQACMQPATVEERATVLHKTMADFLQGKNPCAIPEKELHKELKRCKKCLVFSGVAVMVQARCGGTDRRIRIDILDRDIYDRRTQTPSNTSWTMNLLSQLNQLLGPGSEVKPVFPVEPEERRRFPDTALVQAIADGGFDDLFGAQAGISQIVHEAEQSPPPPPSVSITEVLPISPISPKMPIYPPIAMAARIEGLVNVTFEIGSEGQMRSIAVIDGPKMLQQSVAEALAGWRFPESSWGSSGRAAIQFRMNCTDDPK